MKALIVEPIKLVRDGISKILLNTGISAQDIAIVETIDDAIESVEFFSPDLVICSTDFEKTISNS